MFRSKHSGDVIKPGKGRCSKPLRKLFNEMKIPAEERDFIYVLADVKGVVFVENACDEDVLKIEITSINKNFARAKIVEILEPSQYRNNTSFCAMANVCGGCQWSYIDYEHQLDAKQQIIQEALNRVLPDGVKVLPTIRNDEIKNFRHKIQLPVSQTKNSKRFLI